MPADSLRSSLPKRLLLMVGGIVGALALVGLAELTARKLDPLTPQEQTDRDAFDFQAWTLGPCYRESWGKLVPVRPPHEIVPGASETFPRVKPPGVRRIVVVGESTGEMLENELARLTSNCHDKVEVLRCSASGSRPVIAVRRAIEALDWSPDVLVVAIGHNFLLPGAPSQTQLGINRSRLIHEAHKLFPSPPAPAPPPQAPTGLDALDPPTMGRTAYEQILAAAKPKGVAVTAIVLGSNLWLRPNPGPREEDADELARARVRWARSDLAGALSLLKAEDGPLHAYERGLYEQEQGDFTAAKADFEKARDTEPNPTRASTAVTQQIVAAAQAGGARVLSAELFMAPGPLPGWEIYFDNVHPRPRPLNELAVGVLNDIAPSAVSQCAASAPPLPPGPPNAYSELVEGPMSLRLPDTNESIDHLRRIMDGPIIRLLREPDPAALLKRYDQERLAQTPPTSHAKYLIAIAETLRDRNRLDLARWCLDQSIAAAPTSEAYYQRALLGLRANQPAEARADYGRAVQLGHVWANSEWQ